MSDRKIVQFQPRDEDWLTLERALETAFRVEQLPEDTRRAILTWARDIYEKFGRRTAFSLNLSMPTTNPAEAQVLINSIKKQLQPVIHECDRRWHGIFLQLIRAQITIKKLEAQASAR